MFLSKQALPQPHGHSKARILAKPTTENCVKPTLSVICAWLQGHHMTLGLT